MDESGEESQTAQRHVNEEVRGAETSSDSHRNGREKNCHNDKKEI